MVRFLACQVIRMSFMWQNVPWNVGSVDTAPTKVVLRAISYTSVVRISKHGLLGDAHRAITLCYDSALPVTAVS